MTYSVDWAAPEDIDGIMAVEDVCFVPGIRENRDVFSDRLCHVRRCNTVLRITETGGIYGYFCSERRKAVPEITAESFALNCSAAKKHDPDGHVLYISSFAVRPDAPRDGAGLGRFLFRASVEKIQNEYPEIDRIVLMVNETWKAARRIYDTEGFETIGRIPSFFTAEGQNAQDALVMEKSIIKKEEDR